MKKETIDEEILEEDDDEDEEDDEEESPNPRKRKIDPYYDEVDEERNMIISQLT